MTRGAVSHSNPGMGKKGLKGLKRIKLGRESGSGVTCTAVKGGLKSCIPIQSLYDRKFKSVKEGNQRSKLIMNYNKPRAELGTADA